MHSAVLLPGRCRMNRGSDAIRGSGERAWRFQTSPLALTGSPAGRRTSFSTPATWASIISTPRKPIAAAIRKRPSGALRGKRHPVFLASRTLASPDTTMAAMMQALEGSLRHLQTDYVDIYYVDTDLIE